MRRRVQSTTVCLVCFLFLGLAQQAAAQSPDATVYYCASSWDQSVVYFSSPFETNELARINIQEAYSQFLTQKYSYAGGATSVVCSISQSPASAQSDKGDDEGSVKRATHSVVETGWIYRGATVITASAASNRSASPAASHAAPASSHDTTPVPPHAAAPVNSVPLPAAAATSAASPSQTQAPAAGVEASKLPDVEGIHLGMPIEQASAMIKSLFPAGTHTLTATGSKFLNTSDKPWITSMTGMLISGCPGCQEELVVRFSSPPNPQQVIAIQRSLVFGPDKQPLMEPTIAGLRQKYGPESSKSVPDPVQSIVWLYDELGQHLQSPGSNFAQGCAGSLVGPPPGGDGLKNPNSVGFVLANNPITPSVIATIMRDPCRSNVHVRAQLSPTGPGNSLVHIVDVQMSENALDTRDVIAAQQYLDDVAARQKQQELKNAQQQAAPKL